MELVSLPLISCCDMTHETRIVQPEENTIGRQRLCKHALAATGQPAVSASSESVIIILFTNPKPSINPTIS
jgi:hypothetical protein